MERSLLFDSTMLEAKHRESWISVTSLQVFCFGLILLIAWSLWSVVLETLDARQLARPAIPCRLELPQA